jgi:hypothetical protein
MGPWSRDDTHPANDRTITEVGLHDMPRLNGVVKVDDRDFPCEADVSTYTRMTCSWESNTISDPQLRP